MTVTQTTVAQPVEEGGVLSQPVNQHMNALVGRAVCVCQGVCAITRGGADLYWIHYVVFGIVGELLVRI